MSESNRSATLVLAAAEDATDRVALDDIDADRS